MGAIGKLGIALRAAAHVPPQRLASHVRRRLHSTITPLTGDRYLAALNRRAAALATVAATPSAEATRAAEIAQMFFTAKHAKNVPQCFDGTLTLLNRTHAFGDAEAIDWRIDMDCGRYALWRANLSFMGYLCPAAAHDPERGLALAATLARSFTAISTFRRKGDFSDIWNSYPVSQRILALCALLILLPRRLAGTPEWVEVDAFVRFNVAYLLSNLETELGFNHLERNLSALALYALATGEVTPRIRRALEANFDHVVAETVGADGVQQERSAMYQALVVQSFRILAELDIWSSERRALLQTKLRSVEGALAALTLGDGMPAMLNDAWFGEVPATSVILGREERPGFTVLKDAGYVRLAAADAVAIFDAGPIGPDANPGHGHPDFLAVELSLGRERLIVDPGTSSYAPDANRARERSWDQHNGPAIAGGAPVEFLGSFKVGRRVRAHLDDAWERDGEQVAQGRLAFREAAVRRRVALTASGLTIADEWLRGGGDRLSRFLIPEAWALTVVDERAVELTQGERRVRWSVANATLSVGTSTWTCWYNRSLPAHELVVRPVEGHATTSLAWN